MEMSKDEKIIRRGSSGIWLVFCLLLVAVLISIVLLASLLMDYTAGEEHMISLEPGETKGALTSFFFNPSKPTARFSVSDAKTVWQKSTQVDLFKEAYSDAIGQYLSVESAEHSKLIAPGTSNSYSFTLSNDGNAALNYTMTLTGTFALSGESLPVEVRLKSPEGWLLGSDTVWVPYEALNDISEVKDIAADTDRIYTLDWRWIFETKTDDGDAHDTELGNDSASEENTEFTLNISITAGYAAGAVTISKGRVGLIGAVLLPIGLIGWIILILWWRRFTVTCLISEQDGNSVKFRRRSNTIQSERFFFRHWFLGNKNYTLSDADGRKLSELSYRLKRKRKITGIAFEEKDDTLTILVGKRVMAVELYLKKNADTLAVDTARWAAVDRKHNVYSPEGKKEPDKNKRNRTDSGLIIEKNGKLDTKTSNENG